MLFSLNLATGFYANLGLSLFCISKIGPRSTTAKIVCREPSVHFFLNPLTYLPL